MLDERGLIPCKVSSSVRLKVGEPSTEFNSGCSVLEVAFPTRKGCQIGFIKFKNSYVASISVRVKYKNAEEDGKIIWKTVLKDFKLMPSPHHETGSQDYFIIDAKNKFVFQAEGIVALRIILRQPSPHWINFDLEELAFFLPSSDICEVDKKTVNEQIDTGLEDGTQEQSDIFLEHDMDFKELASKFNKIVTLAKDENVKSSLNNSAAGRFDVGGSYDLNLLAYT